MNKEKELLDTLYKSMDKAIKQSSRWEVISNILSGLINILESKKRSGILDLQKYYENEKKWLTEEDGKLFADYVKLIKKCLDC